MSTIRIPLNSRKHPGLYALIDDADYELVSQHQWHPRVSVNTVYAEAFIYFKGGSRKHISMHRLILDAVPGKDVDHIDGNGLNNCKSNLRQCSRQLNASNQRKSSGTASRYIGVNSQSNGKTWRACVSINYRKNNLGTFPTEVEAAIARDEFVRGLPNAEFYAYNFPKEGERHALSR